MIIQPERITSYSLSRTSHGDDIRRVIVAAINGIDAGEAIKSLVTQNSNKLIIGKLVYDLTCFKRIFIIAAGKASIPMAGAICEILHGQITSGLVITKEGYGDSEVYRFDSKVKIIEANHPVPDQRNLVAGEKVITFSREITSDDLVICLLSGGGSAVLTKPLKGILLQDIQLTTDILLRCGASITEINTVRKHIDSFKGGGLIKFLNQATVITLTLSDVIGDDLGVVASGPTVADSTTFDDVWAIFNRYQLIDQIPANILSTISAGIQCEIQDTLKPGDPIFNKNINMVIGNNSHAISSAFNASQICGFDTRILPYPLQGEASRMGEVLAVEAKSLLSQSSSRSKPICWIAGGETTVTVKGTGKGGRNLELALGTVKGLAGLEQIILISLATDGGDGPTDAAGAVTTNETYSRGIEMELDPDDYLMRNDSYHYFKSLGDLITTGPTMTNVNDLIFIFNL